MDTATLALIVNVVTLLAVGGVVLLMKYFLPSYLDEKGKNLATKEDIAEITEKVERVKVTLGSRLHVHQIRYEKEYDLLVCLCDKLVELRDAAVGLRPELDHTDPQADEDVKTKRLTRLYEATHTLYQVTAKRRPFYPEHIHDAVEELRKSAHHEGIDFRYGTRTRDFNAYWDEAQKNAAVIREQTDSTLLAIRERVKYWEDFE